MFCQSEDGVMGGEEGVVVVQPGLGLMFPNSQYIKSHISKAGIRNMPLLVVFDCTFVTVVDYSSALVSPGLCTYLKVELIECTNSCFCSKVFYWYLNLIASEIFSSHHLVSLFVITIFFMKTMLVCY